MANTSDKAKSKDALLLAAIDKLEEELATLKDFNEICGHCLKLSELYDEHHTSDSKKLANRYIFLAAQALLRSGRIARSVALLNALKKRPETEAEVQMLKRWATEMYSKTSRASGPVTGDEHLPVPTPYQEMKGVVAFDDEPTEELTNFARQQFVGVPSKQGLFSLLNEKEFEAMLELAVVRDLTPGTVLFREGDQAEAFYIVAEGEMELESTQGARKVFREGQFFGELALFSKTPRTATLFASKACKLLEFSAEDLETCFMLVPNMREKVYSFYELRLFYQAAAKNRIFQRFTQSELEEIADYLTPIRVPEGRVLIEEGANAESFFVIAKGFLAVTKEGNEICKLGPGHFVGEIGLILNKTRTARVQAITECYLLECQNQDFAELLRDYPKFKNVVEQVAQLRDSDHSDDPTDPGFRLDPRALMKPIID